MGSDSDLPVMKCAAEILEKFGVPHEVRLFKFTIGMGAVLCHVVYPYLGVHISNFRWK